MQQQLRPYIRLLLLITPHLFVFCFSNCSAHYLEHITHIQRLTYSRPRLILLYLPLKIRYRTSNINGSERQYTSRNVLDLTMYCDNCVLFYIKTVKHIISDVHYSPSGICTVYFTVCLLTDCHSIYFNPQVWLTEKHKCLIIHCLTNVHVSYNI